MTKKTQRRLATKRAHDDLRFSEAKDFFQQEDTEEAIQALKRVTDRSRLLSFLEELRTAEKLTAKQILLTLETRTEVVRLSEVGFLRRQVDELIAESIRLRRENHPVLAGRIEKLLEKVFGGLTIYSLIEEADQ